MGLANCIFLLHNGIQKDMTKDDISFVSQNQGGFVMRKKHFFSRLLALSMALLLLPACAANTDMTITDQNGKEIEVSSAGNDTYTFKVPTSKPLANGWDNPFIDVTEGAWYYDAVRYCYENSLMLGTTENTFSPNAPTSRAMIVAILWRLEGSPSAGRNTFRDVPENQYYADAVAWAASQGIVSGFSDEIFAPGDAITREQMAAILYRYASYQNWDIFHTQTLDAFADAHTASGYAEDALSWAASHDIISGTEDRLLTPRGEATRAQVATILMNLCETIAE